MYHTRVVLYGTVRVLVLQFYVSPADTDTPLGGGKKNTAVEKSYDT